MTEKEYLDKAKFIWKTYVPKSGQSETVQGELIRVIEKLRYEAQGNGNVNWGEGFEILIKYLRDFLMNFEGFDKFQLKQIQSDIKVLSNFEYPYTEDDLYDRILFRIIDWYVINSEPIAHVYNPDLYR
ncbi:hypothetical protein [Aureivirga sp. CE67]|uniref:hypothetical protein n=1 Tax=Aureivirga sp. CE67 TaxID=1788983 RepID=UPI0018CB8271|nr:hypothetical protein [Aureivirga sp. CE67]